ncbi:MAG: hypothetical protein H7066_01145, partial [Cytophagaceae bacterium]|nr:hypothetical protein [Gemmatimonadaceae bacterium]
MRRAACGLAMLLAPILGRAQAAATPLKFWYHTSWTGDAGPPLPGERLLMRGSDGYLWLSGAGGITRFDGRRFTVLEGAADADLATKQGFFSPSLVDTRGTTWIRGPETSLLAYTGGVMRTVFSSGIDGSVTEDGAGRLWVRGPRFGILRDGRVDDGHLPIDIPLDEHFGVAPDTGMGLWIGTRTMGLYHVVGDSVRRYGNGRIRALLQSRDGAVWAIGSGLGPGLWRLHGDQWSQVTLPNPTRAFSTRFAREDAEGAIWFPTSTEGVVRWSAGVVEQFTRREGLSSDRVHDLEVAADGTAWIATDAGLDRLQHPPFITLGVRSGLPAEQPQGIVQDMTGTMWLHVGGRSVLYELRDGAVGESATPLRLREHNVGRPFRLLAPARRGGVWLGTDPGGLIHLGPSGRTSYGSAHGLPTSPIQEALDARDGTLWLFPSGGKVGRFRGGRYAEFAPNGRVVTDVVSHVEDGHGRVVMRQRYGRVLLVASGDASLDSIPLPAD